MLPAVRPPAGVMLRISRQNGPSVSAWARRCAVSGDTTRSTNFTPRRLASAGATSLPPEPYDAEIVTTGMRRNARRGGAQRNGRLAPAQRAPPARARCIGRECDIRVGDVRPAAELVRFRRLRRRGHGVGLAVARIADQRSNAGALERCQSRIEWSASRLTTWPAAAHPRLERHPSGEEEGTDAYRGRSREHCR